MIVTAKSDIGIKRASNQDSCFALNGKIKEKDVFIGAVCDGMGGLQDGDKASAAAVILLRDWSVKKLPSFFISEPDTELIKRSLTSRIFAIDNKIQETNDGESGTTICLLLLFDGKFLACNVGDSRAYHITKRGIVQITKDHTWVQDQIDAGKLTKEEAAVHRMRNTLTRCIGAQSDPNPDFYEGRYQSGDVFFLCSDGFRHKIKEDEMHGIFHPDKMTGPPVMEETLLSAIETNKNRSEKDNITGVLIKT